MRVLTAMVGLMLLTSCVDTTPQLQGMSKESKPVRPVSPAFMHGVILVSDESVESVVKNFSSKPEVEYAGLRSELKNTASNSSEGTPFIVTEPDQSNVSEPCETKLNSGIQALLNELHTKNITRQTLTEQDATSLSSRLVRIDKGGRIQVYLEVEEITPALLGLLKEKEVSTELTNPTLRIIQAWVPFDRIAELAELPSVKRIRPPDYGVTRSERP